MDIIKAFSSNVKRHRLSLSLLQELVGAIINRPLAVTDRPYKF